MTFGTYMKGTESNILSLGVKGLTGIIRSAAFQKLNRRFLSGCHANYTFHVDLIDIFK